MEPGGTELPHFSVWRARGCGVEMERERALRCIGACLCVCMFWIKVSAKLAIVFACSLQTVSVLISLLTSWG